MSPTIFRIFNPGGPKENAVDKRRAQLRNAQRSYRDRKDKYTKSLEQELARVRANETKLAARCDQLSATVQALTKALAESGITLPPSIADSARDNPIVQYQDTTDATIEGFSHQLPSTPLDLSTSNHTHGNIIASSRAQVPSDSSCSRMCELDPMSVGMEFVLAIERPCLEHLGGDQGKPSEPSGHALTVSAQLIFSHSYPPKTDPAVLPPYHDAPSHLLQRLLDLSTDLCSDGELTPTQAWNYIRTRPQFGGFEIQRLQRLAEKLRAEVKCHGFGAVINSQNFERLVFQDLMFAQDF
ncbi:hypothetical protein LY78DRAFT_359832 [Colletotrichum sublineola]|nr:hypothetical protein LY78DRAFT_359832 [Colletotrichum sublineola]